jgi:hypothetical protein
VVFSLVFSAMVISNEKKYGPIGIIFTLLTCLIAIGVAVILGAVAGLVWQERWSGTTGTGHLLLRRKLHGGQQLSEHAFGHRAAAPAQHSGQAASNGALRTVKPAVSGKQAG